MEYGWIDLLTIEEVAEAHKARWEIEYRGNEESEWFKWAGGVWNIGWQFRARSTKDLIQELEKQNKCILDALVSARSLRLRTGFRIQELERQVTKQLEYIADLGTK